MIQQIIQNNHFTLLRSRQIEEMQGTLWEMEHGKSGAKLVWLQRQDENMTFAVGFRTIPTDSTGVFHILEHSVLAGSDRYPVKEPFVELLKSSLQTFLNAMTYPDKTVYPVSSRNRQDFRNLMQVYLDAVLHPTAVKCSNVFRQEGWRLEFDDAGEPMFQGVVYNEMKGAFSNTARMLERAMMAGLFPDNCYGVESGGDPAHIPELSYEQFVAEHRKYYHPSNALIALDGDVDLQDCLSLLDGVLSAYDRQVMEFPIPIQQPLPFRQARIGYEVAPGETGGDKTIVAFGKLLCRFDDPVELHAAALLADYLAGDTEAPLKRAVLDAGLGADMEVALSDGMQQAWFGWQVWNTREEKIPEIRQTIRGAAEDILRTGLDEARLEGCYNSMAFRLMDRDGYGYPRGLAEVLGILDTWLYGGDPAQNLHYRRVLEALKERLHSGYLEDLLRRMLLDESEGFMAVLCPDPELGRRRAAEEKQRAKDYWASLTPAQRQDLKQELERVHTWQQTPDSPEALATIPMLTLADIQGDPKPLPCTQTARQGRPVLLHDVGEDLSYLDLLFDASDLSPRDMGLLRMLTALLGTLGTGRHDAAQLQTAVRCSLGSLTFQPEVYQRDADHHRLVVAVRGVCLSARQKEAAELMAEILTSTCFADADAVAKMLRQMKTANAQRLVSMGNRYAAGRVSARQTSAGAARELLSGCEGIRWVAQKAQADRDEVRLLLPDMQALCRRIFCRSRLTVSLSRGAASLAEFFLSALPEGSAAPEQASFPVFDPCREGIPIPAGVGYAAKGGNLEQFGRKFTGQMYVLSNLLTFEYLWSEVRVKGGAYGTGFRVNPSGDLAASSYRDPTPGRTLDTIDGCADAVERLCGADPDLTKYILGAMTDADPLLSAREILAAAETRFLRRTTQEEVAARRRELLGCTARDLLALCPLLRQIAAQNDTCIIAGSQLLTAAADKIDTTTEIPC